MPRLFAAIELDPDLKSHLHSVQERVKTRLSARLRWVREEQLHLTLVFIGEVDDRRAEEIVDAMHAPFACPVFAIEFGGFGVFPPHGAPRVLWIDVRRGAERVMAIQEIVAARLAALGVAREKRPYRPHLTLARWADQSRPSDRPRDLPAVTAPMTMDVTAVTLFRSQLSPKGSTYAVLAAAPLTGAEPALH